MMMLFHTTMRRIAALAFLVTVAQIAISTNANAGSAPYYTGYIKGVAAGGYDPVAYFTVGKPVRGKADISIEWDGVKWRFSSVENRDAFLKMPKKYSPQYGGYCAYAVAIGGTAKGDPRQWKIVDGKLYLNYNRSIKRTWEKRQSSYIKRGNKNWPRVLK